jgi:hypothetical protein
MHGQIFRVTVYKTRKWLCECVLVEGGSACACAHLCACVCVRVFVCVCVGG